jgi:hypothetical protein
MALTAMPAPVWAAMRLQGDCRVVLDRPAAGGFAGAVGCTHRA